MPFTLSHAAAIIPFHRKRLVLSALIVGSMSPDFLYYVPFIPSNHFTHTFRGLFLFCLPASLIVLLIYHKLLKYPLVSLLPWQIQSRLINTINSFKFLPPSQLLWIVTSILLGALTHIVWDSFTHINGQAVLLFSVLSQPVFTVAGETIFLYKLLQYLSTVFGGLIFVAWFVWLMCQEQPADCVQSYSKHKSQYWLLLMILCSCMIGLIYGWSWFPTQGFKSFVVQSVITSSSSFFILLLIFSVAWQIRDYGSK